ncbi:DUF2225 domain-containing protein [Methanocella conradii]|uniref:DUF2225 domain-containing protein n=1 Tax=Methanocella conradii TaxID=1175444 RepID=UPI00157D29F7|nr:DUF2225 domain-containing protein [Methanocella conradii]
MTTIQPVRLTCPLCGNIFESPVVMSTNSFGKLHSDLYREASGIQPVCYFVHTCPSCGYTGYEGDFEKQEFSFVFRQNVEQNITPEVKGRKIGTNGHFYLAALCAEWRGAPAHVLARIYHMGAWCCRIKDEKEKERFYLGKAAEYFERALASSDAPKENIPIFTYLLGDLYRRLGEAEKAKEWYSKVEQAIKEHGGDPRIGEFARRQLKEASDFFT